jgi:WD40 repeat protein
MWRRVWNLESSTCTRVLEGHTSDVYSVNISPDGKTIVSSSSDKMIRCVVGACHQSIASFSGCYQAMLPIVRTGVQVRA